MDRVFKYISRYWVFVLMAVIFLFIQAMCELTLPDYMSDIINTGVINSDINFILDTGKKMLIISLIGTLCSISVGYFASRVAARTSRDLRSDVFRKVQSFSNEEFDKFSTASLITRTTNDITQIQSLIVMMVRLLFYAPILGIGGTIKAVSSSLSLSRMIVLSLIVIFMFIIFIFVVAMPKMKMVQTLIDRLNLVSRENLEGMLVIRAFNTQKFEAERFNKANKELTNTNLFVNRVMTIMMPTMTLIMNITIVLIVWFGAKQISKLDIDIGTMMAFMQYAIQIISAFLMLSVMFIMIPRAAVSANRIKEVLDMKPSIRDKKHTLIYDENFDPDVEFKNVSFTYPEGKGHVLENISFTAKKHQTTAIIGATGCGKSTVINLLMRFYDVSDGQILIDGKDIRDVGRQELRSKIGYVPQKSILFSGNIRSNLYYADKNSTFENIQKAADIAQATEFIESKPETYDAPIAQGGTNVSGGQKQRLSIARALVKNAPIYIFDDSFSALDLNTDKKLRAALKSETGDSTILLVAQRVGTIMNADQIIVLDKGRIVGKGTHKELMKNCMVYREIALSQMSKEELDQCLE